MRLYLLLTLKSEMKGIHIIITAVVEVYLKFMHQRYMISRWLKMK